MISEPYLPIGDCDFLIIRNYTHKKTFKHTFSTKFTTLSSFEIIFKPGRHLGIKIFAEVAAEISFPKLQFNAEISRQN